MITTQEDRHIKMECLTFAEKIVSGNDRTADQVIEAAKALEKYIKEAEEK